MTIGTKCQTVPCPKCLQAPTRQCRDKRSGNICFPHAERIEAFKIAAKDALLAELESEQMGNAATWLTFTKRPREHEELMRERDITKVRLERLGRAA